MAGYVASLGNEIEVLNMRITDLNAVIAAGDEHAALMVRVNALKMQEYETKHRTEIKEVKHKGYTLQEIDEIRREYKSYARYESVKIGGYKYTVEHFDPNAWDKPAISYTEEEADLTEVQLIVPDKYKERYVELEKLLHFAYLHQSDYVTKEEVKVPYQVHHPEITRQISELQQSISSAWNHYQQAWRSYQTRYGKAQDIDEPTREKRALEARSAQASFEVTVCEALGFDGPPKEALRQNHSRVRIPFEHWIDNTATAGDLQTLCIAAKVRGHKLEPLSDMLEADLRQQKESGHGGLLHQARGVYKWLTLRGKEAQELERA